MNSNDPTQSHDEILKAELGLGMLRALMGMDADQLQNDAVRAFQDGHQKVWNSRMGLDATKGLPDGDDMAHSVRIDSPDEHHHYHRSDSVWPWILPWIVIAALGTAAVVYYLTRPTTPAVDADTDTRSTLRPYTEPTDER